MPHPEQKISVKGKLVTGTKQLYALKQMLSAVGIAPSTCHFEFLIPHCPLRGQVASLLGSRTAGVKGLVGVSKSKFLLAEHLPHVTALREKIKAQRPNIIIALGSLSYLAVCNRDNFQANRGTLCEGLEGVKVLPTHTIKEMWQQHELRPLIMSDLHKAWKQSSSPELKRPQREIWIKPDIEDIERYITEFIEPNSDLSTDIESMGTFITCIGFAPTCESALVIPFYDFDKPDKNYWPTVNKEKAAWRLVKRILQLRKRNIGQNYLYDANFLWAQNGLTTPGVEEDTMLLHHALHPELKKGLGFLASLYSDEISWKKMRTSTIKKEN